MRVTILTLCILTNLYSIAQTLLKENERIIQNKIKSITTFIYYYKKDTLEKQGSHYKQFDKNGKPLQSIDYNRNGQITHQAIWSYNENMILIGSKQQQFDYNGKMEYATETICDSFGHPIKRIDFEKRKIDGITIYIYDTLGKLIKEETQYPRSKTGYIRTLKYNTKKQVIEDLGISYEIYRFRKRSVRNRSYYVDRKYIYKYDNNGNKTEELIYRENDQLDKRIINLYDNKANRIEYSIYNSKDSLLKKEVYNYTYDSNNLITESNFYDSFGKFKSGAKMKHDNKGNLIETRSYTTKGPKMLLIYEYEFY